MDLIIASSNINKIKRLKILISTINPEIKIKSLNTDIIKVPLEGNECQRKNLVTKLNYYYRFFGKNVICEDDAFEFNGKNGNILIVNVNSYLKQNENKFELWKKYFKENNIERGKLIKYFGVNIDGKLKTCKMIIALIVKTEVVVKKSEKNILNNFVGPQLIGKTFTEIPKKDKNIYMNDVCLLALKKIL